MVSLRPFGQGDLEAPFLELAHRLDRETSGCLVLAKRRSFLRAFQEQLRAGEVSETLPGTGVRDMERR